MREQTYRHSPTSLVFDDVALLASIWQLGTQLNEFIRSYSNVFSFDWKFCILSGKHNSGLLAKYCFSDLAFCILSESSCHRCCHNCCHRGYHSWRSYTHPLSTIMPARLWRGHRALVFRKWWFVLSCCCRSPSCRAGGPPEGVQYSGHSRQQHRTQMWHQGRRGHHLEEERSLSRASYNQWYQGNKIFPNRVVSEDKTFRGLAMNLKEMFTDSLMK